MNYILTKEANTTRHATVFEHYEEMEQTPSSLATHLAIWANIQPEAPCLIEAETGRVVSYRQFLAAVHAMQQFLGVTPCTVFLALHPGLVNAAVWIAALTAGHTLIPLSPEASSDEQRRAQEMFLPDVLLIEQDTALQDCKRPGVRVLTQQACETLLQQQSDEHDELVLTTRGGRVCLMTSGTTGEPKGVVLAENQVAWAAETVLLCHSLTQADRGLTVLPFFHVNAPVVSLCASLMAGSSLVVAREFSLRHFWSWVDTYDVTWISIVPAILALLLETDCPDFLPAHVRFVRTASAPLSTAHLFAFEDRFGLPVIETYELTEAASQVTTNPLPPRLHKPGSVGLPTGVALRICRPHAESALELEDVARGEIGEICLCGPSIIHQYYDGTNQSSFQNGWFRTGDLGYQDYDGYLFLTDRLRNVIIQGAANIAPREMIEEASQARIEESTITMPLSLLNS